ncbi:UDP-N-acetylglucosamine--peptide N-acetylglucosaminyltransferase SPINDLY [Stenotrophomonas ginsengisoli]|uniref:UDP-N-acetylglucosamine--peptide N-acetylglucosaminyltransferase SPINDLY n=1 Tax=Stenotrophomonas ginsengisoli TaxID=336566 RepID=A0A0R0DG47_9GAMM|nr:tetratricopeptide repeat protein [Stenotrophomonas ginsengisoli]KRG77210.1 UDP-N-acetylglucosamine--peptide N-acetylglucosaminyltransferase SPINDLY [Stenotrophomonas ginsengisoli]
MQDHPHTLSLRQTVVREPGNFQAWVMLSDAELDAGQLQAGAQAAQRALHLRPGHPEALARLGRAHWQGGQPVQAAALLRQASQAAPGHPGIALWLGHALEDAGPENAEAAAQAYRRAHQLAPGEPYIAAHLLNWQRRLCDWSNLEALSQQARQAVARGDASIEPFAFLSEPASAAEQRACASLRARALGVPPTRPASPAERQRPGVLRLGWLSNGFGNHPTGLLTVALAEALAGLADVQLHLFATTADDHSTISQRLSAAARLHRVHGLSHAAIAAYIRQQQIDVLFDLRGWGGGGTPEVLALRPAPVQVNWLAYPGTSGAPWMDWILADEFVLPAADESGFSERVMRLPHAFQPSDTARPQPAPPSRKECGLPAQGVVFCCFNNSYKINPRSFARLMAVLHGVKDSVLWLLSGPGQANARLQAAAAAAGIAPQRLVFMDKLPHQQYLARYALADLFLDTSPYNAHTTASDALWSGCPVLTTPGQTFADRVAGSLNHHLGLAQMNRSDDADFIATAIALGNDAQARARLRQQLQQQRQHGRLFDMQQFARDFASASWQMYDASTTAA